MYKPINNLKKIREEKGLTQEQLVKLTGIPQRTISGLETRTNLRPDTICKYAEILEVHPSEIITYVYIKEK